MRLFIPLLSIFFLLFGSAAADSSPYAPGDRLDPIVLSDQHGEEGSVDGRTKLLIFAPDRSSAKIVHAALGEAPEGYLPRHRAAYVADISSMPSLVARFIALPTMRLYPYRILLAATPQASERLPRREGLVTLIELDDLEIVRPAFCSTAGEIATALESGGGETAPR